MKNKIPYDPMMIDLFDEYNINLLPMGCFIPFYKNDIYYSNASFPLWIYEFLKLDIDIMYSNFKIPRDYNK